MATEHQQEVVRHAARKYQRAAQVSADAAIIMLNRFTERNSNILNEHQVQLVAAALPTITEAILADQDILEPEEEE